VSKLKYKTKLTQILNWKHRSNLKCSNSSYLARNLRRLIVANNSKSIWKAAQSCCRQLPGGNKLLYDRPLSPAQSYCHSILPISCFMSHSSRQLMTRIIYFFAGATGAESIKVPPPAASNIFHPRDDKSQPPKSSSMYYIHVYKERGCETILRAARKLEKCSRSLERWIDPWCRSTDQSGARNFP